MKSADAAVVAGQIVEGHKMMWRADRAKNVENLENVLRRPSTKLRLEPSFAAQASVPVVPVRQLAETVQQVQMPAAQGFTETR